MPAERMFNHNLNGTTSPALRLIPIVPNAADELAFVVRDIRVGATVGDVTVVDSTGTEVTFTGVSAGEHLGPFFVKQVKAGPAGMVGYV